MPPESLTVAVTSGFGIGIIAGIVSGVCYILVHGFSSNRPRSNSNQWNCCTCGERFRSIGGVLELDKVVTCTKCGGKVCRKKCSNQDRGNWICQKCLNHESWFKGVLKTIRRTSTIDESLIKMDPNRIDKGDATLEITRKKEKEQVRDFIERLVEGMLGGGIDGASIGRLYTDEQYLPILGQSPCSAHAGLKLLIEKVIREAIGLPTLKKATEQPSEPVDEFSRTYEDILATAIINKVIENYQDELPISSGNNASNRISNVSTSNDKEYFFGEETLDAKWRNCNSAAGDLDTTSVSSVDEWVHSSSSSCSTKYVDQKSLTIQQRSPSASSSDEENKGKSWQENWKLQKRQFTSGTASSIPVPMLVPNPTVVAKVLIGDRDADDTTDLSDAASECDETERVEKIAQKTPIFDESKDEILSDGTTDDLDIVEEKDRVLQQFSSYQSDREEKIWEFIKPPVGVSEELEDTSLDSHIEQDSEYTEKYATLPKTILKCSASTKSDPYVHIVDKGCDVEVNRNSIYSSVPKDISTNIEMDNNDGDELRTTFEGSYSEREKQKWKNAVEMKHNPYTEENIHRRLHETSSAMYTTFGRDYYIKEASRAAGARNLKEVSPNDVGTQKLQEFANETASHAFIFKAVPAIVEADSSYHTDSDSLIENASPVPPSSLLSAISTDSDLSIERTYNLTSGKVYEKVGDIHKEIIKRTSSPQGLKFTSVSAEMVDENHNSMTERKQSFLRSLTDSDEGDATPTDLCQKQLPSIVKNQQFVITNGIEKLDNVDHNKTFDVQEVSMYFSTESEMKTSAESSLDSSPCAEIGDLKDRHLVKDRLGLFSRSYPNLSAAPLKKTLPKQQIEEVEDKKCVSQIDVTKLNGFKEEEKSISHERLSPLTADTSVNNLRKRFATVQGKDDLMQKEVHSLTARSIPQLIRKELQESEYKVEVHNDSSVEVTQQETTVNQEKATPPPFPHAKSRIKFFENLNR